MRVGYTCLVFYNLNGRITPVKNLNARASDGDVPISQSYLVPAFHVFHEVFGLVIANTFPRRRFHTLKVIYAKLNIKMIRKDTGHDSYERPALTSLPFTMRESGSAFMSQYFGDIVSKKA